MKNALLIIDAQYDFCHPEGALYVPNAEKDMERLSNFIEKNQNVLDYICVTLDNHPVNDISHPSFWEDKNGNHPAPFTQITAAEIESGTWNALYQPKQTLEYVKALETQGEFPHFIWPEHCLIGSKGASLDENLLKALRKWTAQGKQYQAVRKGEYPFTEHFGIFQAQIPKNDVPETQLNTNLLDTLNQYDKVFLAGQAKSHCVATSLKQIMDNRPELARKVIVLEDCMSDVAGMGHLGEPIYQAAKEMGVSFSSSDYTLSE